MGVAFKREEIDANEHENPHTVGVLASLPSHELPADRDHWKREHSGLALQRRARMSPPWHHRAEQHDQRAIAIAE